MKEYRVTKYDPRERNELGHYMLDDWIDYSCIGGEFLGKRLTLSEYLRVERSYINAVIYFMEYSKINGIRATSLEKRSISASDKNISDEMRALHANIKNRSSLGISKIPTLCKLILRGCLWAKLYSPRMFVHFGYDYYMFIGAHGDCSDVIKRIEDEGLFVEPFYSPYFIRKWERAWYDK